MRTLVRTTPARAALAAAVALPLLAAPVHAATPPAEPAPCPPSVPADATCVTGTDVAGAPYWAAVPAGWEGDLVVHAHGGPSLGESTAERSEEDLDRWSVMVREGYAWVGSSYRRGGYGVRMAAEDTEHAREAFVAQFGEPRTTFLHGQSWGGNVAAKLLETDGDAYDAALLTAGLVAGGTRGYDYRLDLRVVYQYYCGNHPRPDEMQYPLWMGLAPGQEMSTADLRSRLQECTGYRSDPSARTPEQQQRLDDVLAAARIPEESFESHMTWATRTFADLVHERLDGRNPFTNMGVRYTGTSDDRALNAGVQRYARDPLARRDLAYDSDLTGVVDVPTLSLHAIGDPTVFVEQEDAYRLTREAAGTADLHAAVFTTESEHSYLQDPEYVAAMRALSAWTAGGERPTPDAVAAGCVAAQAEFTGDCLVDPAFVPGSYDERVAPRGGTHWPRVDAGQMAAWERRGGIGIDP